MLSFYAVLPNSDLVVNVRGGAVRITGVPVGSGRVLLRHRARSKHIAVKYHNVRGGAVRITGVPVGSGRLLLR